MRVSLEPGVSLLLDPDDHVGGDILENGCWEAELWAAIERRLPRGGTFVDVGAHIGYHSLKAAARVGEAGCVVAIEANPRTFAQLEENVRASGAAVTLLHAACLDRETEVELYSAARRNTGGSSVCRANAGREGDIQQTDVVAANSLDALLRQVGVDRVDVMKIDVEGAELQVLRGAAETLDRFRPAIVVEFMEHHLKAMGTSVAELSSTIESLGYELRETVVSEGTPNGVFERPASERAADSTDER